MLVKYRRLSRAYAFDLDFHPRGGFHKPLDNESMLLYSCMEMNIVKSRLGKGMFGMHITEKMSFCPQRHV